MKKNLLLILASLLTLTLFAQTNDDSFEKFRQQQSAQFNQFRNDQQAQFDAFRKKINTEYADFMRKAWAQFSAQEPVQPVVEPKVEPVVFEEPAVQPAPVVQPKPEPKPEPKAEPKVEPKPEPKAEPKPQQDLAKAPAPEPVITKEDIDNRPIPRQSVEPAPVPTPTPVVIPIKETVIVLPEPTPAPEPIAPVQPKPEEFKRVTIAYFGTLITVGFPMQDNLRLASLSEDAIADAWTQLADSRYDITVKTALDARKANALGDWAYMNMLRKVCEKQYGVSNTATLAQAFLMVQSGYRIRLGHDGKKLQMLVASQYDIYSLRYYQLDGTKFYVVSGDKGSKMHICEAKYDKERSLSLQMAQLPKLSSDPTAKRTLSSRKGVTAAVSVNKNLIDFFNTYPQACYKGNHTTRWAAYANTPLEKSVKDMLYPSLKKTIAGMTERQAVEILLNWVQTAFEYKYDDEVWGDDRAFFAQETLHYPYCDCEDRSILFSRLVRDLLGLDVVLLYYPGHLATAVAFSKDENGDYLTYKSRKYIVCDPTYINAGVGRTMPGMNNKEAQVIALK